MKQNNPKVSIIIPVYNVEQYLRQCLDSVCNQTFKDIEIIIVNDCSPDNSLEIIKEYQRKDERIVLVDLKQNVGLGFARNEGMKVAKGKYITFVDSDDWIANNYVEVLYNEIESNSLDVVCAAAYIYNNIQKKIIDHKFVSADKLNRQKIKNKDCLLIPKRNCFIIPVWLKIYKKSFLLDNNIFFELKESEDNLFFFYVLLKTENIKFIDDKIYYYRINREYSLMQAINKKFNYFKLFEKLKERLIFENRYNECKRIYYQYISILTASKLEVLNLKLSELKFYFNKFRTAYYNTDFKKNCSAKNLNIILKIRLLLFCICLRLNINYAIIGKLCRNFKLIYNK
ncbi:glycosyltransferase family 2 protein [Candidatus Ruminimicrobiellum ovillum]|uniref:glycosyltransferase family 2 protein n=1 Tax=Candidatus Ruminimicrobiellum ovillum TaxID=1947927 RepID=UPI003559F5BD